MKGFFDYLWSVGKVQVDPAAKIRRFKEEPEKPNFITYEMLLEALPPILHNPDYSTLRKTIYILALKGIRFSDYVLPKGNVIDKGETVDIYLKKRVITLEGIEAEIFLTHFLDAQFNSSDYVFITKKRTRNSENSNLDIKGEGKDNTSAEIVPVEVMSIYTHLNAISEDYNFPAKISLNLIRHAYANYLYTKQKMVIEEIAMHLGIENESAANLVRISQNRYLIGKELLEIEGKKVVR
ncbi:hypothetical protein [Oceanobacillus massiliensis]|uniref:hypothetical protein n=1 Tax=Oceanobacillus massiliensis TaxID=1465765 RepID=UPI00301645CC